MTSTPYETPLSRDTTYDSAAGHLEEALALAKTARASVDHQNYERGAALAALATMHAGIAAATAAITRNTGPDPKE